ncbi:hypothetical protein EVAR_46275_1 [Eumeta japonica]|uniref:Uncharacterized protein n=1 Tax=Eumeta variegata TaxID=151549 RepID=A0A4C1Y3U3_EUMVA|nr:hypothetical protein EVAR_46275_1 [Eumeta japonica]
MSGRRERAWPFSASQSRPLVVDNDGVGVGVQVLAARLAERYDGGVFASHTIFIFLAEAYLKHFRHRNINKHLTDDKSDDFDSFTECGRTAHASADGATCAMDDAWWKSSRHRMSQETVTGRFPSLLPGRRRLAAAGWSKGA